MEIALFPTADVGESKSKYVAKVIEVIQKSGYEYQLTPMGTIIEAETIEELTALISPMYKVLEEMGVGRVYGVVKFDIRPSKSNRLKQKVESIQKRLGQT